MKKIVFTLIIRMLFVLLILEYLPFIYRQYGEIHPEGGANAMGRALYLYLISSVMAMIYLLFSVIASRIFKEKTKLRWKIEAGIVFLFMLFSTYIALGAGITSTPA